MRFFSALFLATLTATGVVTAMPVAQPHDLTALAGEGLQDGAPVEALDIETNIETREARGPNTPADVKKHDDNHKKQDVGNCGQGCKDSLASYHSQASKDSKNSKASKNSKNGKNGPRAVENVENAEEAEVEEEVEA
ncbi:hypothetical protein BDP55DRAFT_634184 [Colletotrichum godetiae]|uniref:Uncharacterized protein n=1 Tax=Colletotrichum godetiae TaxID=1209918 RepID=A0AAJ0EVG7_9PEZI|nr:uncharacterized protein BDP55DRAFT_634184 [Colletotrichum godetiae]KAK1673240.1 hypothetical protein BDP55DRAFT_634184 [Colletotrichum godetiae]